MRFLQCVSYSVYSDPVYVCTSYLLLCIEALIPSSVSRSSKWGPDLGSPMEPTPADSLKEGGISKRGLLPLSHHLNIAPHLLQYEPSPSGSGTSEYTRSNSNNSSSSSSSSSKKSSGDLVEWQPTSGDKDVLEFIQS